MRPVRLFLILALCSALAAPEAWAQAAQPPKHEFRGAWIATVFNLDWPRAATPAEQQAELLLMLDRLKEAGINAVFIQVRSACDALYDSPLEPLVLLAHGAAGRRARSVVRPAGLRRAGSPPAGHGTPRVVQSLPGPGELRVRGVGGTT